MILCRNNYIPIKNNQKNYNVGRGRKQKAIGLTVGVYPLLLKESHNAMNQ